MGYIFQMMSPRIFKNTFLIGVASFCLLTTFVSYSFADDETYGYQQQNKEEEQKKYFDRLREDKKKVDFAIQNTKMLIDKSRNKPYLPELYIRLSELYIEKSRIIYFLRKNLTTGRTSSLDDLETNTLKNQAIEIYQRILSTFPDFEDRDKIHFYLAHEYRELNRIGDMVAQYRIIISKYKSSKYVPESYLLLGDYFLNKQDLDLAERHYKSVLNYPESQAIAIARYKLAWCHINKMEFKKAMALFEEAVLSASRQKDLDIDTYKRVNIRLESLIDMAYYYSETHKNNPPEQALAYFQKYAWSRQVYVLALEKLAYRFLIKKKWNHAAVVYRELSELQQDPEKLMAYAKNIFECVQTMGTFGNADKDMGYIVHALQKQKYSIHIPDEDKKKNEKDFELYARNLVTHLHEKARKRKSVSDFKRAADAYEQYLDFFTDSPVRLQMAGNYAEALFSSNQYLEAGKQYEALAVHDGKTDSQYKDPLYSSIISYYNALKEKENMNYFQTAFARDGLRTTGKLYASAFPASGHVPDVLFNVAWVSYDAGKFDDAITEFTAYIKKYPSGKPTTVAIHLTMDAYNLKEDYEGLLRFGKKILANKRITDRRLIADVAKIVNATESRVVSNLTVAALDDWDKGKSDLLDFAKKSKSSEMGEQALNTLLVSSKEKGDLATLLDAGESLIKKFPSSSKVEIALGEMIDGVLKAGQFRLVAGYLEAFAKRLPGHANTRDFLYQAGNIRKNLGQYALSNRDYEKLLSIGSQSRSMREEVVFSMADNAVSMQNTTSAIKVLQANGKGLSPSGRVRADAVIADLYLGKGNTKKATFYRSKAYKAYTSRMGKKDPECAAAMAKMVYHAVNRQHKMYMSLSLKNKIDNNVVMKKTKLLEKLEKGYQGVMAYPSPNWALIACYKAYEINREFSRFLKASPLPDLSPEQKTQYIALIDQKANGYDRKAEEYLNTCIRQAHKWEVCDPKLAGYFNVKNGWSNSEMDTFSGANPSVEIAERCLKDQTLKELHEKLLADPENPEILSALSEAYIRKGDFKQALLITQKSLSDSKVKKSANISDLYNNLGLSHLYSGNDELAKDAFRKALASDRDNISAKLNLAGLFNYYGHTEKAEQLYSSLSKKNTINDIGVTIHPRAKERYYEYVNHR